MGGLSNPRTVGEVILFLRARSGMGRRELADKVGVSENTLKKYEENAEVLSLKRLRVLRRIVAVLADATGGDFDAAWSDVRRLYLEEIERQLLEAETDVVGGRNGGGE